MESGDSIRGMALDSGFPLVMVVGYRGWTRHGVISDSAARYTEPFLNAFRINYYLVEQIPMGSASPWRSKKLKPRSGPWPCWSVTNTMASTANR